MTVARIFGLVGWLVSWLVVPALTQSLDSLRQKLAQASTVVQQAELLNQIAWLAYQAEDKTALEAGREALDFAQAQGLGQPLVVAHLQLGEVLRDGKELEGAAQQLQQAKALLNNHNYPLEHVRWSLFTGKLAYSQRNYESALIHLGKGYQACPTSLLQWKRDFLVYLAKVQQRTGNWEAAEHYLRARLALNTAEDSILAFDKLGTLYAQQQNFVAALPFYEKSFALAQQQQDNQRESRAALNIGNIHLIEERWGKAVDYYMKSGALKEKVGDEAGLAILHNNIAAIYKDQERYQESLDYYKKSQAYYERVQDSVELAKTWVNIAVLNVLQQNFQAAIELLRAALPILDNAQDASTLLIARLNMGFAYSKVGKYQVALNYLELAEQEAQRQDDWYSMTAITNLYGGCYYYLQAYDKAIQYHRKALRLGEELELLMEQKTALFGLYESEQHRKNYKVALEWLSAYNVIDDSLTTLQTDRQLVELQEQYEAQEKEREIDRLNIENQNVELANALQARKINLLLVIAVFVGLLLILLSLFFFYRQQQQKIVWTQAQELHKEKVNQLMDKQALTTLDAVLGAQQKERKSLAKEIHDTLGSFLATIKYQHEAGQAADDPAQYHIMAGLIEQACDEVRSIAHQMATGERFNFDLMTAIEDLVERIKNTQQFAIEFQYFGTGGELSQKNELLLYRIVQELFSNILKHAQATQATLQINQSETEWTVIVEDNGSGFDKEQVDNGLGLKSISERVEELQGQWELDTSVGRGTTVVLTIPSDFA